MGCIATFRSRCSPLSRSRPKYEYGETKSKYQTASSEELTRLSPEHLLAHERNRRAAVREELVVELLPRLLPAARCAPVVAELADHQLAHRVIEICRIVRAARRLLACVARVLVGLLLEHRLALFDGHALRVQTDRAHVAHVAQQCIEQLADVLLGRILREPLLDHQLLSVVRP